MTHTKLPYSYLHRVVLFKTPGYLLDAIAWLHDEGIDFQYLVESQPFHPDEYEEKIISVLRWHIDAGPNSAKQPEDLGFEFKIPDDAVRFKLIWA